MAEKRLQVLGILWWWTTPLGFQRASGLPLCPITGSKAPASLRLATRFLRQLAERLQNTCREIGERLLQGQDKGLLVQDAIGLSFHHPFPRPLSPLSSTGERELGESIVK